MSLNNSSEPPTNRESLGSEGGEQPSGPSEKNSTPPNPALAKPGQPSSDIPSQVPVTSEPSSPEALSNSSPRKQNDSSEFLIQKVVESTVGWNEPKTESLTPTINRCDRTKDNRSSNGLLAAEGSLNLGSNEKDNQPVSLPVPPAEQRTENDRPGNHDSQGSASASPGLETTLDAPSSTAFHPLDPRIVQADRIVFLIILGIALLICSGSSIGVAWTNGITQWPSIATISASGLISFVLLILTIFWPKLEYNNVRWRLDRLGFEIHKGVFWKHRIAVPLARIQHVDVTQGPIERFFSLGSIVVYTAGSQHSDIRLNGLDHQVAKELKDHILKSREAQHVL